MEKIRYSNARNIPVSINQIAIFIRVKNILIYHTLFLQRSFTVRLIIFLLALSNRYATGNVRFD